MVPEKEYLEMDLDITRWLNEKEFVHILTNS